MPELTHSESDALVVGFETGNPISASVIASLLRDLSGDYKRVTGGNLALWRYETGSCWIHVRDAVAVAASISGSISDIAAAVQNMARFVDHLRGYYDPASASSLEPEQIGNVTKSATRIAKIAAENRATVEIEYNKDRKAGVESFRMRLSPDQAAAASLKPQLRRSSKPGNTKTPVRGEPERLTRWPAK